MKTISDSGAGDTPNLGVFINVRRAHLFALSFKPARNSVVYFLFGCVAPGAYRLVDDLARAAQNVGTGVAGSAELSRHFSLRIFQHRVIRIVFADPLYVIGISRINTDIDHLHARSSAVIVGEFIDGRSVVVAIRACIKIHLNDGDGISSRLKRRSRSCMVHLRKRQKAH